MLFRSLARTHREDKVFGSRGEHGHRVTIQGDRPNRHDKKDFSRRARRTAKNALRDELFRVR